MKNELSDYMRGAADMQKLIHERLNRCVSYYEALSETQRDPIIEQLANIYRIEAKEVKAMPLPDPSSSNGRPK